MKNSTTHHIPPFEAVTLVHRGGRREVFRNLEALIQRYGYWHLSRELGDSFKQHYSNCYSWYETANGDLIRVLEARINNADTYVLLSANGEILTPEALWPAYEAILGHRGQLWWNGKGPVPGTGRSRRYYDSRRRMKLFNARRMSVALDDDVPPRAQRQAHNLPNSMDAPWRATVGNDNWKRYRRQQWKAQA
ncbi:hypothetical protein ACOTC5_29935 [Achromobacter xylosoxidans]